MNDRELCCYSGCSSHAYSTSLQLAGDLSKGTKSFQVKSAVDVIELCELCEL